MPQCFFQKGPPSVFAPDGLPELIYACWVDDATARILRAMHVHEDQAELVLICGGCGIHHINNRVYHTKAGDLVFYNSGSIHDEAVSREGKLQTCCIGVRNLCFQGLPRNHFLPESLRPVVPSGAYFTELRDLFAAIYRQAEARRPESREIADYLARALLTRARALVRELEVPLEPEEYSLGRRVKQYLDEHYMEEIRLDKIAAAVHANAYYLSHAFKAMSGYAPMQYVTRRRIGEAQNLLINTECSVTEIAAQVGYGNSNHFQNVFRALVGMPPGRYRRQWQSQPPE